MPAFEQFTSLEWPSINITLPQERPMFLLQSQKLENAMSSRTFWSCVVRLTGSALHTFLHHNSSHGSIPTCTPVTLHFAILFAHAPNNTSESLKPFALKTRKRCAGHHLLEQLNHTWIPQILAQYTRTKIIWMVYELAAVDTFLGLGLQSHQPNMLN